MLHALGLVSPEALVRRSHSLGWINHVLACSGLYNPSICLILLELSVRGTLSILFVLVPFSPEIALLPNGFNLQILLVVQSFGQATVVVACGVQAFLLCAVLFLHHELGRVARRQKRLVFFSLLFLSD